MKVIAFKVCLLLLAAAVAISAAITFWCFALPSWNRNFGDLVKRESNSSNSSSKAAIAIPEWLPPGEDELWRKLESELPFAPLELMRRTQERGKGAQDAIPLCERLPSPSDLWVVNRQWQRLRSSSPGGGVGGEFYLFSAHLDARRRPEEGGRAAVRVLAMVERRQPLVSHLRCLLWDDDWAAAGPPKSVPVDTATMIWGGSQSNGEIFPFLITCLLEEEDDEVLPAAVSLAMDKKVGGCNRLPSNALRVDHSDMKGRRQKFAVCVKGLSFQNPLMALRLVEWIELLFILGVDKIFIYYSNLAEEIMQVLEYYERRDMVDFRPFYWGGPYPLDEVANSLLRKNRIHLMTKEDEIPYNDCFYRNLGQFDYISVLDVDEVPMPLVHDSWEDMVRSLEEASPNLDSIASFTFHNAYFMDRMMDEDDYARGNYDQSVPKHLHMLRHLARSKKHAFYVPKSIVRTTGGPVKSVGAHRPLRCFGRGACKVKMVGPAFAHLAHYRDGCQLAVQKMNEKCSDYLDRVVEDRAVLRFKDQLVDRVATALMELGFLPENDN